MLEITLKGGDYFNNQLNEFIVLEPKTIQMEHSLFAISKWESITKKPFLTANNKDVGEFIDYFRCMTLTENVNPLYYTQMSGDDIRKVTDYIGDSMTATVIYDKEKPKGKNKTITAEVIYYWMVALQIPFECQYWHLNRLMTLINVINFENNPNKKKQSKREILSENRRLNDLRRAEMKTSG